MARPSNLEVPFHLAKRLWEKVWHKFQREESQKISSLKTTAQLNLLHEVTAVGTSVLSDLKKTIESVSVSEPSAIKMSQETINGLCNYVQDDEIKAMIFSDPDTRALFKYFCKYQLYWRDKKGGVVEILRSELEIHVGGITLSGDAGNASGGRIMLKNANLFFSVENEGKKSSFIFNVGTAGEDKLNYIPGLCLTLNSDVTPVGMAVLLFRASETDQEPDKALMERYFDKFQGREFVPGVKLSWFTFPPPDYRISGLFGNWYIYNVRNSIIRRGKIRIEGERHITYVGTVHKFHQGHIEIFNTANISITLCNDSKILHLTGRIGDQSDLSTRSRIRCIFSSTGRGGSTLKAGVSLMVRETNEQFDDMTSRVIVSEDYPEFLTDDELKLILNTPEDIEI